MARIRVEKDNLVFLDVDVEVAVLHLMYNNAAPPSTNLPRLDFPFNVITTLNDGAKEVTLVEDHG